MALTIRTLSDSAQHTLEKVIESNEHINTNTKAIEYVLENYLPAITDLERECNKISKLERDLAAAIEKLYHITHAFDIINKMIVK